MQGPFYQCYLLYYASRCGWPTATRNLQEMTEEFARRRVKTMELVKSIPGINVLNRKVLSTSS